MEYYILNFLCAAIGTICFAMLYNANHRYYISIGLVGGFGYLIFLILDQFISASTATFIATVFVVLSSRILAIYKKCPITIFLVSGILALLPSPKIFYTSYYLIQYNYELAAINGMYAIKIAFSIVIAIAFMVSIPKDFFNFKFKKRDIVD